jgi:cytochrome c oxidase subunit II
MDDRVGMHSISEAMGSHAQHIDSLWHVMLWVCGFMFLLVMGFMLLALFRRGQRRDVKDPTQANEERGLSLTLTSWIVLIVLGLFGLTLFSYITDRALVQAAAQPQIAIQITAHQWWWEIEYTDPNDPSRQLRTANELHLPVGTPVKISLQSRDVIHSFWVPNLHGKQDMIPGRDNDIELLPQQEGVFRGLCAEFCGLQHSKMHLDVVVEAREAYTAWYDRQLQSAPQPTDALAQQGHGVFMATACNLCHTISGTEAAATTGPDLSHVASRRSIASGALQNHRDNMRSWLANPQAIKPGSHMPTVSLSAEQLDALTAYLGSLR